MKKAQVEINRFVGGLITDASPLTFPENTSSIDVNMELNIDGSRKRALGIDYEVGGTEISTTITSADSLAIGLNSFRWENVGGDPLKTIVCVQVGNQVKFFDGSGDTISAGLIDTKNFPSAQLGQKFSFSSVDGGLVIVTGQNYITIAKYDEGVITFSTDAIKVRDFFGVEDTFGGADLTTGSGLGIRPTSLTSEHLYNLRNQSFAIPRLAGADPTLPAGIIVDPIEAFRSRSAPTKYPSNSDAVTPFLYADATDASDRNSKRYFAKDGFQNPLGSVGASKGYFIIDLLSRGTSRLTEAALNNANFPLTSMLSVASLPTDSTPGGPTVVGEFAGRVWYGGFSGEVVDGDARSPHLSSYIAFSQLVTNPSIITKCYQDGDPTSEDTPDIVDTDGGYIRLNNAYGVTAFLNLGKSLFICAANGIWRVFGGNDSGFSATNYVVEKITDKGVQGANSLVEVENTLLYWSEDGIYWVKQNQFGDWVAENQTVGRIQTLYNSISAERKESVSAVYDGYQRKVRWLYNNSMRDIVQQKELVFNVSLNAFYERHFSGVSAGAPPILVSSFNTNIFKLESSVEGVTASNIRVVVGADNVTVTTETRTSVDNLFEIGYIAVTQVVPVIKYRFCTVNNSRFVDWEAYNGTGVDAPAVLVTGVSHGGETLRFKQVPYLNIFLRRTEDGFELVGGSMVPTNQSSCLVQSQWDWTNSANANKWSSPFQAYRYKRHYLPLNILDPFDTGYEVVATKNKLRGRGRSIALRFTSSPLKEMHIYGWSLNITVPDDT